MDRLHRWYWLHFDAGLGGPGRRQQGAISTYQATLHIPDHVKRQADGLALRSSVLLV